jgi:translocation and assembly module TamA
VRVAAPILLAACLVTAAPAWAQSTNPPATPAGPAAPETPEKPAQPIPPKPPEKAAPGAPPPGTQEAPKPEEAETPEAAEAAERQPLKVTWVAPDPLRGLYERFLPPPGNPAAGERRGPLIRAWVRDVRRRVPQIAASEGYFSATLEIQFDDDRREHVTVTVTAGELSKVDTIDIRFAGDIAGDTPDREKRREELRASWMLNAGAPFRSPDWETAKTRLLERLTDVDYAAGTIAQSEARVDADAAKVALTITLDSGPRFTLGAVHIEGLKNYPDAVIRRLLDLKVGEPFMRARLQDLQRLIQTGPWFSSVVVDIERDPTKAVQAPVRIAVVERVRHEVGLAVGYGTDDGARIETTYRDRNLFERGFDLQSSIRAAQKQQFGYIDIYLPPGLDGFRRGHRIPFVDSFGVLVEHTTFENLATSRFAVAGYRDFKLDDFEIRPGLSYQIERDYPQGSEPTVARALAPVISMTWRHVDNLYDPHRGGVLNVQFAVGSKNFASGENFFKAYTQYQHWLEIPNGDQILLRGELGRTFAPSRAELPQDFLFRAGGSRSNRGYAYQSLGVQQGDAVVGGRYIATGTVEYVHWLNDRWGGAVFTDVGDADDSAHALDLNPSYGVGARVRTPAGPLGLDLAYAQNLHRFRLSFSVTVAF